MRKFFVLVTDERNKDPSFSVTRSRYIVNPSLVQPNEAAAPLNVIPAVQPPSRHRFTHEVAGSDKGKSALDKNNLKRKRSSPTLDDGLHVSSLHHVTGDPPEKTDIVFDQVREHRGTRLNFASGIQRPEKTNLTSIPTPDASTGDVATRLAARIPPDMQTICMKTHLEWRPINSTGMDFEKK